MSRVPLRKALADLPPYVPGARVPVGAAAFKLSSNENPYPPLPSVVAAIADAAVDVNRYPDMYATELVEAIAASLGVAPESVVAGCGSVAVLGHVLTAVCEAGDEVVLPWRSFEAYPIAVTLAGAEGVRVPVGADGRLDLEAMAKAVTSRTRAVLVCTPNNPTGPAVRADELARFLASVPSDVLVVLDEAYVEFVRDEEAADGLAAFADNANVVLLRTFSKAYGLAGLRVGYAVARPRLAAGIRAASTPFGVSHVAQLAALASLRARDELLRRVGSIVTERSRMLDGLRRQGWTVPDSQANFVWLPLGDHATAFAERCTHAGVLVRPFAGDGVRVSVGEPEATDLLLEVTADWSRR
ncbi:histidinol-phosphate transaminase [Cellulomonas fimi]|uniref:Aromatic amino acid aminotransferase n=1 Tax=Cellulomonas fimi (strain ATCC 484 / DSM 20113 / JCM 1341 / CCUG 24087 / LMG 16345 / NBRC 15513 / NCIMB 8980 / NCTC 7547 / NRS-133) TaxID=590998 RepID=F4H683_CELFA|nr:histidinol-phosphate transaminase [Cellulomonas fimi]AEE44395.1 histidinol-phosphate aminotransferase [Cellulomonas fimi ATCC 484]NNH08896.1 histidinol-phosphate transaminase [Cellulomonas fimi]VEH26275.1 Putative phenylalanine aminotransferase [Cellulomonas fimi]